MDSSLGRVKRHSALAAILLLLIVPLLLVSDSEHANASGSSLQLAKENTTIHLFHDHIEGTAEFVVINEESQSVDRSFIFTPGYFSVRGDVQCDSHLVDLRGQGSALLWDMHFEPNQESRIAVSFTAKGSIEAHDYDIKDRYYHTYAPPGLQISGPDRWSQPVREIVVKLVADSDKFRFPEFARTYDPSHRFSEVYWEDGRPVFEFRWENLTPPPSTTEQHRQNHGNTAWSYTPYYPVIAVQGTDFWPVLSSNSILVFLILTALLILNRTANACAARCTAEKVATESESSTRDMMGIAVLLLLLSIAVDAIVTPLVVKPQLIDPFIAVLDESWSISSLQVIHAIVVAEGAASIDFFGFVVPYLAVRVVFFYLAFGMFTGVVVTAISVLRNIWRLLVIRGWITEESSGDAES